MNDRKQVNIEQINKLWRLHERLDQAASTGGKCLAFAIDKRYIDDGGIELRLGVSFGDNLVSPQTRQEIFPIPVHPGRFVFGLHLVGIKGNQLMLCDKWENALDGGDCTDAEEGEKRARSILEAMSDAEYLALVADDQRTLKVSSRHLLEEFEVVKNS